MNPSDLAVIVGDLAEGHELLSDPAIKPFRRLAHMLAKTREADNEMDEAESSGDTEAVGHYYDSVFTGEAPEGMDELNALLERHADAALRKLQDAGLA